MKHDGFKSVSTIEMMSPTDIIDCWVLWLVGIKIPTTRLEIIKLKYDRKLIRKNICYVCVILPLSVSSFSLNIEISL